MDFFIKSRYSLSKILQEVPSDLEVRSLYQMNQTLFIILENRKRELFVSGFRLHRGPYAPQKDLFITSLDPVEVRYYLIKSPESILKMDRFCESHFLIINDTPVDFIECEDSIKIPKEAKCLYAVPDLKPNYQCISNIIIKGKSDINDIEEIPLFSCLNDLLNEYRNDLIEKKNLEQPTLDKNHTYYSLYSTNYHRMSVIIIALALLLMLKKCHSSFTNSSKLSHKHCTKMKELNDNFDNIPIVNEDAKKLAR